MPGSNMPQRKGPSGPVNGAARTVTSSDVTNLSNVDGATVTEALDNLLEAQGPIQNIRFLDNQFAGATSLGSIGLPYVTFAPFFADITSGSGGWELTLPGRALAVGGPLPDLLTSPIVKFSGLDRDVTVLDALQLPAQSGAPTLALEDLTVTALSFASGSANLKAESAIIGAVTTAGTLTGSVELTNVDILTGANFHGRDVSWHSGSLAAGSFEFRNATFENIVFGDNTTLIPDQGITRFLGCLFGSGVTISNANTPVIYLDPYSWSSFLENNVAFTGQHTLIPVVLSIGQVRKVAPGTVDANDTLFIQFGDPLSNPKAEPGTAVVGSFAVNPGGVPLSILNIEVDSNGSVNASIANNSGAPVDLEDPLLLNIVYVPRQTAL